MDRAGESNVNLIRNMTSKLEQKWWFDLPVGALAAILTLHFVSSAGIQLPYNFPQWVLFFLGFTGYSAGFPSLVGSSF